MGPTIPLPMGNDTSRWGPILYRGCLILLHKQAAGSPVQFQEYMTRCGKAYMFSTPFHINQYHWHFSAFSAVDPTMPIIGISLPFLELCYLGCCRGDVQVDFQDTCCWLMQRAVISVDVQVSDPFSISERTLFSFPAELLLCSLMSTMSLSRLNW